MSIGENIFMGNEISKKGIIESCIYVNKERKESLCDELSTMSHEVIHAVDHICKIKG